MLTCGIVSTDPAEHAMSRISDAVGFSLDARSQSQILLDAMAELVREEMAEVATKRRVRFGLDEKIATAPALMDATLASIIEAAMARIGLEPTTMASGGGHDAAVFSNAVIPSVIVFVRNHNG